MDDHETDLWHDLRDRLEEEVPKGATVGEAMAAMAAALAEDPELSTLAMRMRTVMLLNGREVPLPVMQARAEEVEQNTQYVMRPRPDQDFVDQELLLIGRMSSMVDQHISRDATPQERERVAMELMEADPKFASLVDELRELADSHPDPIADGLATLAEEEREEEERLND